MTCESAGPHTAQLLLLRRLSSSDGWEELQQALCVDSYDVTEFGALSVTAAAVKTSIDLSAAATLRL